MYNYNQFQRVYYILQDNFWSLRNFRLIIFNKLEKTVQFNKNSTAKFQLPIKIIFLKFNVFILIKYVSNNNLHFKSLWSSDKQNNLMIKSIRKVFKIKGNEKFFFYLLNCKILIAKQSLNYHKIYNKNILLKIIPNRRFLHNSD